MKKVWLLVAGAVALSALVCSCSDDKTTTPAQPKAPTVATVDVSGVSQTTAESGGNITSDGGAAVTVRGV
jgi:hypothetical protein